MLTNMKNPLRCHVSVLSSEVATCYLSGDPHYGLFDGLMLHYQGVCRYNLASSREHYPDLPYFRVLAKSERRHGNMHYSYPRYVDVEVFGHTVRLDKGKKVYVSGQSRGLFCNVNVSFGRPLFLLRFTFTDIISLPLTS